MHFRLSNIESTLLSRSSVYKKKTNKCDEPNVDFQCVTIEFDVIECMSSSLYVAHGGARGRWASIFLDSNFGSCYMGRLKKAPTTQKVRKLKLSILSYLNYVMLGCDARGGKKAKRMWNAFHGIAYASGKLLKWQRHRQDDTGTSV